mgnify:CR=1 FL=1
MTRKESCLCALGAVLLLAPGPCTLGENAPTLEPAVQPDSIPANETTASLRFTITNDIVFIISLSDPNADSVAYL